MPHTARRPRASSGLSGRGRAKSAPTREAHPRPRPQKPADPYAALDAALTAAAASPPPGATTFGALGLDHRLVSALEAAGISEPFAIQARALPDALAGRDVLGRAQTGSGKTLAFGLPLLTRLAGSTQRRRERAPRGLILVPTRELAEQVAGVLGPFGRKIGVRTITVYGGVSIVRQIERARGADLVVATPGRLIDLMERGACALGNIEITVLDEADHMADLGFMPAVTRILDATPAGGQRLLFSATLDRGVGQLVTAYVRDPALHAVAPAADAAAASHLTLVLAHPDKVPVAAELASGPGRTLFFVRTKHGAERLAKQLSRAGVGASAIHGDRNQNQRQRALDAFTAGHPRVLVATDVAARGIHVDDVDLVVQFDPPKDHKDYLHRAGRTARAGATGMVVTLADQAQVGELQRLHAAAGVTAAEHEVTAGHEVIKEIAASGVPVPPPPAPAPVAVEAGRSGNAGRPEASRRRDGRGGHGAARRPQDTSRPGSADRPDRADRPAKADRPDRADRPAKAGRPAEGGRYAKAGRPAGTGRPGRDGQSPRSGHAKGTSWGKGKGKGSGNGRSARRSPAGGTRRAA
ncbi:MAG TPA: DEAD/DEAH box helicase [Streptosporangiaceae bacterium]|nr:DEAD/DEAH box helicase [Streptosporangiaceae bacterium]